MTNWTKTLVTICLGVLRGGGGSRNGREDLRFGRKRLRVLFCFSNDYR